MSSAAAAPRGSAARWFFGPLPDLLFGCGLLYLIFFVWQVFDGPGLRSGLPLTLLPLLTLLVGSPHYGATLLRVYENRDDRRRYAIFAVWATAALALFYVAGLRSVWLGSVMITLYFTWSPWHYAGQNYGLALLFLRRRGVAIAQPTKRLLYASFLLSYALILLMLHTEGPVVQAAPATLEGTVYSFFNLGIPRPVRNVVAPIVGLAYLGCLIGAAWRLRRAALRDLAPTLVLVGIQLLWFGAPAAASIWRAGWGIEPFHPGQRPYAFMWIAVGHFVQYLWITTYYAAASSGSAGRLHYLAKALLVGVSLWTLPIVLFGPSLLGRLPYDLGLALLTGAAVNLHHFVLDGAIWKLRDGRVARALLRPVEARPPEATRAARPSGAWRRHALWAAGIAVLSLSLYTRFEEWAGNQASQRGDMTRVQSAVRRTERLGRSTPTVHVRMAQAALGQGNFARARGELERARAIYPTPSVFTVWARLHENTGDLPAAAAAYEEALRLGPDHVPALAGSASVLLRLDQEKLALERLERAAAIAPRNRRVRILLDSRRKTASGDG